MLIDFLEVLLGKTGMVRLVGIGQRPILNLLHYDAFSNGKYKFNFTTIKIGFLEMP
jgi:hypothetical protein